MEILLILLALGLVVYALIRIGDAEKNISDLRKRLQIAEEYIQSLKQRRVSEQTEQHIERKEEYVPHRPPEQPIAKQSIVQTIEKTVAKPQEQSTDKPTEQRPAQHPIQHDEEPPSVVTPPLPPPLPQTPVQAEPVEEVEEYMQELPTEVVEEFRHELSEEYQQQHEQPLSPQPEVTLTVLQAPAPKPSRTKAEWESFVGGKLLNRIGALALIIGIGFFLKYAFDNNWISETLRCLMGGAAGAALLLGADRMRKKDFLVFAQGLVGAGIVTLYLSVYAAFNFYHLVPQIPAFAMMIAVTCIGFLYAWRYSSIPVALLTWAGGFLTPFLLSTGTANEIGLFGYICFLDLGILAMLLPKKEWRILEFPTLLATLLMYMLWKATYYAEPDYSITVFFLAAFGAIFFCYDVWRLLRREASTISHQMMAIGNPVFIYLALMNITHTHGNTTMAFTSLLFALPYILLSVVLKKRGYDAAKELLRIVLGALIPVVIGSWQYYNGNYNTVFLWSLEAALLALIGSKSSLNMVRLSALALFAGAIVLLCTQPALFYALPDEHSVLLNKRALAEIGLVVALFTSVQWLRSLNELLRFRCDGILHYAWMLVLLLLLGTETTDYFNILKYHEANVTDYYVFLDGMMYIVHALVWLLYSGVLAWIALRTAFLQGIRFSIVLVICSSLWLIYTAIAATEPHAFYPFPLNVRSGILLAGIVLLVIHMALSIRQGLYQKEVAQQPWLSFMYPVLGYTLFFVLITLETKTFFTRYTDALHEATSGYYSVKLSIGYHRNVVMAIVWIVYSGILFFVADMPQTFARRMKGGRAFALILLIPVWMILLSHSFFMEQFSPFLNSRAAGYTMTAALLLWYSWRFHHDYKNKAADTWRSTPLIVAAIVLLFAMLTSEIFNFFHVYMNVLYQTGQDYSDTIAAIQFHRNSVLSIVWILYSLAVHAGAVFWKSVGEKYRAIRIWAVLLLLPACAVLLSQTSFVPLPEFMLFINTRALGYMLATLALLLYGWQWKRDYSHKPLIAWRSFFFYLAAIALSFLMLNIEVWDFFERKMYLLREATLASASATEYTYLRNMQQLLISAVWILYSVLLMVLGLWKHSRTLRIIAILLFFASIIKVFAFDLSFLTTLYRIFSFMGLGVMLLAISYLYQKYKHIIFEDEDALKKEQANSDDGDKSAGTTE